VSGIVDVDEDAGLLANIVDSKPEDVERDVEAQAVLGDVTEDFTLPMVKPC